MPNGTGNFRNFQISRKKDNRRRLSTIFETNFQKRSVPFDFVPEFPEILVKWIAPIIRENRKTAVFSFQVRKPKNRTQHWPNPQNRKPQRLRQSRDGRPLISILEILEILEILGIAQPHFQASPTPPPPPPPFLRAFASMRAVPYIFASKSSDRFSRPSSEHFVNFPPAGISLY